MSDRVKGRLLQPGAAAASQTSWQSFSIGAGAKTKNGTAISKPASCFDDDEGAAAVDSLTDSLGSMGLAAQGPRQRAQAARKGHGYQHSYLQQEPRQAPEQQARREPPRQNEDRSQNQSQNQHRQRQSAHPRQSKHGKSRQPPPQNPGHRRQPPPKAVASLVDSAAQALFVGNLPPRMNRQDVVLFLSNFGDLKACNLHVDPSTGTACLRPSHFAAARV